MDSKKKIIEDMKISSKLSRYGLDPVACGEDGPKEFQQRINKVKYDEMKAKRKAKKNGVKE